MDTRREKAPGAVTSLVLGILGIVICGLLAPFAWQQGKKAEALARSEGYDGEGLATAGKVLGIIGTAFLVITFVVVVILAASGNIGNS